MAETPSPRAATAPIYRENSAAQTLIDRVDALAETAHSTLRDLEARLEGVAFGTPPAPVDTKREARMVPDFFDRLHGALDVIESNLQGLQSLTDRVAL